jgi:predicted Zn-dependent protease
MFAPRPQLALVLALSLSAGPALAQKVRSISASDKAQGAQAHPQLLQQYGGAYTGPQAALVERVGKRVAVQSGLSNAEGDFHVTLLDTPVENAFAIPGGYVYVTRQLLALMNSEAELASVLGHEVGHVAARHSAKRNNRSTIGSILAAGVGVLTGSDLAGQLAGYGSQLYTLGFSRSQEYAADALGVRYITQAGYDPFGAAAMLASLDAETTLQARIAGQDANNLPSWASTHPNGADRVQRARKLAAASGRGPVAAQDTGFLRALDGLLYDDNPREGVIDGQTFRHPALKLRFTAPAGYTIANGATEVTVNGAGGRARFDAAPAGPLAGAVDAGLTALGAGATGRGALRQFTANGISAAYATVQGSSGGRQVDATVVAYGFPGAVYRFTLVTAAGQGIGPFSTLVQSVARLSDAEAASIRGKRIRVIAVAPGQTAEQLAARMAYPTNRLERFRVLNGLEAGEALRPGRLVKIVSAD